MNNPAQLYDQLYADWIGPEITQKEIALVQKHVGSSGKILDIGCGTGRHLIPLHNQGYKIIGIDQSKPMINELKTKLPVAEVVTGDILHPDFSKTYRHQFDGVISFWNVLMELALDEKSLKTFFQHILHLLKKRSVFIFSLSDAQQFEPQEKSYVMFQEISGSRYKLEWQLLGFDTQHVITLARETISQLGPYDKILETASRTLMQKQWQHEEVLDVLDSFRYKVDYLKFSPESDTYYILKT